MRYIVWVLIGLVAAACSSTPATPAATATPPLVGAAEIVLPQTGTIVFAPTLYVSGTSSAMPAEGFRLLVTSAEDVVISDTVIKPDASGAWSAEIANSVSADEPMEVTISALPTDVTRIADYDVVSVVLATEAFRPFPGAYGQILAPFDGDTVGGEIIPLHGTASGVFEGTVILALIDEGGATVTQIAITTQNPGIMDEVPWSAELPTNGYLGAATIEAFYESAQDGSKVILDSVNVTVGDAAG